MGKDLPVIPVGVNASPSEQIEGVIYSRVFCQKDNSPPLRLLTEFLTSRGQHPILPPKLDEGALDEWAWVHVALGYHREREPIQLFCVRDSGSYRDVFDQEKAQFVQLLASESDVEAHLVLEYVTRSRFILTTRMVERNVSDEGYDFNGWILEFYQEQCNGIVQIDKHGFYSPKGELIVDLSTDVEDEQA